jgi:hypothetical protein
MRHTVYRGFALLPLRCRWVSVLGGGGMRHRIVEIGSFLLDKNLIVNALILFIDIIFWDGKIIYPI